MPVHSGLRVVGTVGLATLVPFTGGWAAVASITFEQGHPAASPHGAGSVVPAATSDLAEHTASPPVLLSRAPSPSLHQAGRSALRMPADRGLGEAPAQDAAPDRSDIQSAAKHRADRVDQEPAPPTPTASGRHRADPDHAPSTSPHPDDGGTQQPTGDEDHDSGSEQGGSASSEGHGSQGEDGPAHGHGHNPSNGNGHRDGARRDSGQGKGNGQAQAG